MSTRSSEMRIARSVACLALVAATGCAATASLRAEDEVIEAAERWRAAYDARDPSRIAAQYAPDATFWGSTMKCIATDPAGVAAYFKDAALRPDARVRFDSHNVRILGDVATDSGAYTFTDTRNGAAIANPSRFTMVFQRRGESWTLVHHHSSRLP